MLQGRGHCPPPHPCPAEQASPGPPLQSARQKGLQGPLAQQPPRSLEALGKFPKHVKKGI